MVILPVTEPVNTTRPYVAPGVSGSMMIGLVEEPRTVKLKSLEPRKIHASVVASLKRTGPDPYIEKRISHWLDYLVDVFYENKSEWECE
jgi:hypothetical protein